MMKRHLDTSIVVAHMRGNDVVDIALKRHAPDVFISAVVLAELVFGACNAQYPAIELRRVSDVTAWARVVPFDAHCAEIYGRIRFNLKKKGKLCGDMDMMIAATAVANNAMIVTHNLSHFQEIDGLVSEDWIT